MAPKVKNVLVMLTNVGLTSLEQNSYEDEPFLDKAKFAMKLLVEKKLFLQPKDEIGIVTMGDETTDNPDDLDYVRIYKDHLMIPNWKMLKYIDKLNASKKPSNWIEGFHVALNFIKKEVVDPAYRVFLVVFNNFKEPEESISGYDPAVIVDDVKGCGNLHLLFVGENPLNTKAWRNDNACYSEKYAMKIMKHCEGQYEQIDAFIEERRFYIAPPVNAMPWKCDLEIANMCIPISSYVKINEDLKLESWKTKAINDAEDLLNTSTSDALPSDATKIVKENLRLDAQRNEVCSEEIISGYKFGGQYIPVSEEDEEAMKYEGGEKGMFVYGFAPQSEIKLENWCGKGSRIIVPQTEDSAAAFYSLAQAMSENEYVAIVRKVHANNYLPRMGVLFPKLAEGEVWCLVHLELPYNDEVRCIEKKPIKSENNKVTDEQLDAMDKWIDSMIVDENAFTYLNPGCFPNIPHQYHWNAIADRAVNPENPLLPLPEYIRQYLVTPSEILEGAKPHLDRLNKLFGWSKEQVAKKQTATVAKKSNDKDVAAVTEKDKDVPADRNATDEGFFSPEDMDLDTAELDDL